MLFDRYDQIRIINLPHRADRRREMDRELRKVGLLGDPRVGYFPAVAPADRGLFSQRGHHGCFLSHLEILKAAATADASVLILEDDCDFILPGVLEYRMPEDIDIFYGGYLTASNPEDPANGDIIGSHFMGFSARAARMAAGYLAGLLAPEITPDPRAAMEPGYDPAIRPPVDGAYVWFRRAHPELVTELAMLSGQRSSRTDIGTQRWFDTLPVFRTLAGAARRAKREWRAALPSRPAKRAGDG